MYKFHFNFIVERKPNDYVEYYLQLILFELGLRVIA